MEYTAVIEKTENGWYVAQCEQMPEALTQGRTIEEAEENLIDAIQLLLEDEKEDFRKQYRKEHKAGTFLRRKIAVL